MDNYDDKKTPSRKEILDKKQSTTLLLQKQMQDYRLNRSIIKRLNKEDEKALNIQKQTNVANKKTLLLKKKMNDVTSKSISNKKQAVAIIKEDNKLNQELNKKAKKISTRINNAEKKQLSQVERALNQRAKSSTTSYIKKLSHTMSKKQLDALFNSEEDVIKRAELFKKQYDNLPKPPKTAITSNKPIVSATQKASQSLNNSNINKFTRKLLDKGQSSQSIQSIINSDPNNAGEALKNWYNSLTTKPPKAPPQPKIVQSASQIAQSKNNKSDIRGYSVKLLKLGVSPDNIDAIEQKYGDDAGQKLKDIYERITNKRASQAQASNTPLSMQEQLAKNNADDRKKRLMKYGKGVENNLGSAGFAQLTAGKSENEILDILERMYNADQQSLLLQKQQKAQQDAQDKEQREQEKLDKAQRIQDNKDQRILNANEKKKERERKEKEAQAKKDRAEFNKLLKNVVSSKGTRSGQGKGGLGLLGLLGAIPGLLTMGVPSLLGGIGSIGSAIGGIAGGIGALIGGKGIKSAYNVMTTPKQKNPNSPASNAKRIASKGIKGIGTRVALGGAGVLKIMGKFGGSVLNKNPLFKLVPGLGQVLGAYAVGKGIYNAWNETDSWTGFGKEALWNTGSELANMVTLGQIGSDNIEKFAKGAFDTVANMPGVASGADTAMNVGRNLANRGLKNMFGTDFGLGGSNASSLTEVFEKSYGNARGFYRNQLEDKYQSTGNYNGKRYEFLKELNSKKFTNEALMNAFRKRSTFGSEYNLNIPAWASNMRGETVKKMKNLSFGAESFNLGTSTQMASTNNVSTTNNTTNIYTPPAESLITMAVRYGGSGMYNAGGA